MDMNLEEQIRRRAYHIWECDGRPHGRDCDHWHQATRELVNDAPVSNEAMAADEAIVSVVTTAQKKAAASRPARATKASASKTPAAPKAQRRSTRRDLTLN